MSWGKLSRAGLGVVAIALAVGGCARQELVREQAPALAEIRPAATHRALPLTPMPGSVQDPAPPAHADVWDRIRAGLRWETDQHLRVATELQWFRERPDWVSETSRRAAPFLHFIVEEVERRQLPMEIALLPFVESAFKAKAFSRSAASGLWQFIPATGRRYGLKQDFYYDQRRDFVKATHAALDYLTALNQRFNGDWLLALGGYNAGERNIERAVARNRNRADFWTLRLTNETTRYVPQLLAVAKIVADPAAYGVTLEPIPNEPYFDTIDTGGPVDLYQLAERSGIDRDLFAVMNANYRQHVSGPDGPFHVYVPRDRAAAAQLALRTLPRDARLAWAQYLVERGDTLSTIARRFGTSVDAIRDTNKLSGTLIRAGQQLMIPPGRAAAGGPAPGPALAAVTAAPAPRPAAPSGSGTDGVYVVRPGDNLWRIARQHGMSVARLAELNALRPDATLQPRQRLTVDPAPAAGPALLVADAREFAYEVRDGDSMWSISRRFKVSLNDLRRWNPDRHPSRLQPGDTLRLYLAPGA